MFVFFVIVFVIVAVFILKDEGKKKEAAAAQAKKTAKAVEDESKNFWPKHPLFKEIMGWVRERVRGYETRAAKAKISADSERYLCYSVGLYKIQETEPVAKGMFGVGGMGNEFEFSKRDYDSLSNEQCLSLQYALYQAIKKEYGAKYPVSIHDGAIYIRMDSAHPKLKKI